MKYIHIMLVSYIKALVYLFEFFLLAAGSAVPKTKLLFWGGGYLCSM